MSGPLTIAVVKQCGGYQIEVGVDLRDPGTWSYGQRADGSAGQTAYLTAPELDRVIASLCRRAMPAATPTDHAIRGERKADAHPRET